MASLMEEIADALARDVLRAVEETGDENLVTEVSRVIGSSSTTTQEAFMTAVRVRMSEQRARRLLAEKVGAEWPLIPGATAAALPPVTLIAQAAVAAPAPAPQRTAPLPDPRPAEPEARALVPAATPEPAMVVEEPPAALPEPQDPSRIRPKIPAAPAPPPKPAPAAPAPRSLEAALALATSLPRKVIPPVEPTTPVVNPYADVEVPDGDWG